MMQGNSVEMSLDRLQWSTGHLEESVKSVQEAYKIECSAFHLLKV